MHYELKRIGGHEYWYRRTSLVVDGRRVQRSVYIGKRKPGQSRAVEEAVNIAIADQYLDVEPAPVIDDEVVLIRGAGGNEGIPRAIEIPTGEGLQY